MVISPSGSTGQKPGRISFGDRTISFLVNKVPRRFAVHEDVICRTSQYFKSRYQPHRKPLADDCPICFESLDPVVQDIEFCQKCGQNIHQQCIRQWHKSTTRNDNQTGLTCPLCRAEWVDLCARTIPTLYRELEAWAVQTYLEWLYTRDVRIPDGIARDTDAFNLALLKCWKVGTVLQDTSFRDAIIATFFAEAKAHFWTQSIEWAFDEQDEDVQEMRNFVIEVFTTRVEAGWFEAQSDMWPKAFVKALADKSLEQALTVRKGFEELKAEHAGFHKGNREMMEDAEALTRKNAVEADEASEMPIHGKRTSCMRRTVKQLQERYQRMSSQSSESQTLHVDPETTKDHLRQIEEEPEWLRSSSSSLQAPARSPPSPRKRSNAALSENKDVGPRADSRKRLRGQIDPGETLRTPILGRESFGSIGLPPVNTLAAARSVTDSRSLRRITYSRKERIRSGSGV